MNSHTDQESVSSTLTEKSGPLGFGCGLLGEAGGRSQGVRLLESAFDAGITYFDTARLYAEGHAESMLGDAFARRRDKVLIATKVGILPTPGGLAVRARDKLSTVLRKAPPLRRVIAAPPVRKPLFGAFTPAQLRASIETSLRALKTDFVDVLLLHECSAATLADPDVIGFMNELKARGRIRAWGVAPTAPDMIEISQSGAPVGAVAQFASSAFEDNMAQVRLAQGVATITHSSLGSRFRDLRARLCADAGAADIWRQAVDVDPMDSEAMAQLFICYALRRNPSGVVLFSTTHPARIRENLRAVALRDAGRLRVDALPAALAALASG